MRIKRRLSRWLFFVFILSVIPFVPVSTQAGGGQHYPNGVEAFLIGVLPPPGFYIKEYNFFYTANKLKDNSGRTLTIERDGAELDRLNVYGIIPRFIWVSKLNILGGSYGQHLFIPLLKQDLKLDVATPGGPVDLNERREGVYDLIYSPFIWGWHSKEGLLHTVAALDIFIPVGPYDKKNLNNVGKNFWTFEPVLALTGFLPWDKNLSASIKLMYDFNTKNTSFSISPSVAAKIGNPALAGLDSDITPGQEFHFDYSVAYAITKNFRAGIAGYFYQQTTDDKTDFGTVENDKGRVFAIGPGAWYTYKNWIFESHVAFETAVKNRPQGVTGLLNITHKF
jgi:hypothetical protein